MKMEIGKITGAVVGLGLAVAAGTGAHAAQVVTLGNITVTDYGRIDPSTAPVTIQPGTIGTSVDFVGQTEIGQPGTIPPNAPELANPGWDAYGTADTTHIWWNIYSGNATFALSGSTLGFLWGSPNDDDANSVNYISFYSGADLIGTVTAFNLYDSFSGITNSTDPGYLLKFATSVPFDSVVVGTVPSDFEFAFTAAVPEPATWAMMFAGFASLSLLGWRRSRQPISLSL